MLVITQSCFVQEIFEDALHRVRESELHKTASLVDLPAQVEEHGVPLMTSDGVADSQQVRNEHRRKPSHSAFIQALKSQETSFETLPQKYMFGKMQGSRWARHRPVLSNSNPMLLQTNELALLLSLFSGTHNRKTVHHGR